MMPFVSKDYQYTRVVENDNKSELFGGELGGWVGTVIREFSG